jgi:hypothetical protein
MSANPAVNKVLSAYNNCTPTYLAWPSLIEAVPRDFWPSIFNITPPIPSPWNMPQALKKISEFRSDFAKIFAYALCGMAKDNNLTYLITSIRDFLWSINQFKMPYYLLTIYWRKSRDTVPLTKSVISIISIVLCRGILLSFPVVENAEHFYIKAISRANNLAIWKMNCAQWLIYINKL